MWNVKDCQMEWEVIKNFVFQLSSNFISLIFHTRKIHPISNFKFQQIVYFLFFIFKFFRIIIIKQTNKKNWYDLLIFFPIVIFFFLSDFSIFYLFFLSKLYWRNRWNVIIQLFVVSFQRHLLRDLIEKEEKIAFWNFNDQCKFIANFNRKKIFFCFLTKI